MMNWYDYELTRLEENRKFYSRVALIIAGFGSILVDSFIIYYANYANGLIETHPYPERIIISVIIFTGIAITMNFLTILLYLKSRKKTQCLKTKVEQQHD